MNLPAHLAPQPVAHPAAQAAAQPLPFQPISFQVSEEQKLALLEYWRSIKKRKWAILGLGAAAAVVAAAVSLAITPIYSATNTVQIEAGTGKIVSIEDIYSGGMQAKEHYQTQVEILKSREVADRTVRSLKLWNHPEFDASKTQGGFLAEAKTMLGLGTEKPHSEAELISAATKELMERSSIEPVRLSQLVKVSVESADPALAAKLANALADNYILNDREARFKVSQQASSFLQERLGDLRAKLGESEQALQAYRQSKGIVNLGGSAQTLAGQQVGGTNQQLVEARAKRMQLEAAYSQVRAAPGGDYSGVPWVARDPAVALALARVNELSQKLAQLSQTEVAPGNRSS